MAVAVLLGFGATAEAAPEIPDELARHVAERCLVDELANTEYAMGWRGWFNAPDFVPADAPLPGREQPRKPSNSAEVKARAARIASEWAAAPKSRIVDCSFQIQRRKCEGCRGKGATSANYIAYLPVEVFTRPESVTSMLLLVPGGNGGRTRYFLTPVPGKNLFHKKSGGLETKRRVEQFREAYPGRVPPIVVALDSAGYLSVNGDVEYLTEDLPRHIATTYLGRPLEQVRVGIEGISSGSQSILLALKAKPDAFDSVGLTSLYCGGRSGFDPQRDFGSDRQRTELFEAFALRARSGRLAVRFSIGNRDKFWRCAKSVHDLFVGVGMFADEAPTYGDCEDGGKPSPAKCAAAWPGFFLYHGHGHNYGVLLDSWVPQIFWHLEQLSSPAP